MKNTLTTMIFLLTFLCGCSSPHLQLLPELEDQTVTTKLFSVEQLHQDMDALIEGALARHPELSAYADLDALKVALEHYKSEISEPMNRQSFYKIVGKLNHHFGDGHSFLIWPYHEFNQLKAGGHKPFPFDIFISKAGEIAISVPYVNANETILAGSVIHSINGIPSRQLLDSMQRYVGGETQYLREQIVAQRFPIDLWAVYGFIDHFTLTLANETGTYELIISPTQDWQKEKNQTQSSPYFYKQLQQGIGYLYIAHFDISPDTFEDFLDDTFHTIKQQGIDTLIIDIRNNPGGNTDTVTYLTRYIADQPFRLVSSVREKLNEDNRGLFNYKGEVGDITQQEWTDWETPIENKNHFSGDSYLLVGPVSYSAAIVLATTLKDHKFATLIGEQTQGYANQTAQGNLFNLPNTQLRAYIATRTLVRPNADISRHGVKPHFTIEKTVNGLKENKDQVLEYAIELITNES